MKKHSSSDYLTISIEKYVKYMKQEGLSDKTIKMYCFYVYKLAGIDSRLYRLSNYQIQDFILSFKAGSTQNVVINALQKFFNVNHPKKIIKIFIRPKLPVKFIEILTKEEVWKIIDSIQNIKQKAIISGIYLHGLRISEILTLKYHNIDRKRGLIKIELSKGNKDRFVPLSELWIDYITEYAKHEKHSIGYDKPIFYPYSDSSVAATLKRHAQKVGIRKRIYIHLLRHSYATHLIQQGIDTKFIQEILGHSNQSTTERYIHLAACDISKITITRSA